MSEIDVRNIRFFMSNFRKIHNQIRSFSYLDTCNSITFYCFQTKITKIDKQHHFIGASC